jgi:hypothetical protein
MVLIEGAKIKAPVQGERLVQNLWQMSLGTTLGLYIIGTGDRKTILAVSSPNQALEDAAASLIVADCEGDSHDGDLIPEQILAHRDLAAYHLIPTYRGPRENSKSWGWQRVDPLKSTFAALARVPEETLAGFGLTMRSLPGETAAAIMCVFSSGPESQMIAYKIASSFAGIGVKVMRPSLQRRFVRRALAVKVPIFLSYLRPQCVLPMDELSAFWHPKIEAEKAEILT